MNKKSPFKYAIYTRQSRASGAEMPSCQAQFSMCEDFVKVRAAPHWEWVGERFDDEQTPGDRFQRPGLDRLRDLIRSEAVQYVAVYSLDRLTRKMSHCMMLLNEMLKHGVEFGVAINPQMDTTTGQGQVLVAVIAALAEFEHDLIKSRIQDKFDFLRLNGRRLAGRIPFGYSANPRNKQLIVNEAEAPLVRMMFTLTEQGRLPHEIAESLNALASTARPSDSEPSNVRSAWSPRQILSILANPVYTGKFANKDGTVRPGVHDAIISDDLYAKTREIVSSRKPKATRAGGIQSPYFRLRGVVFCGRCGRPMGTHTAKIRKNMTRCYYRCRSHAGGRPPCKGVGLPAYDLEYYIIDLLLSDTLHDGLSKKDLQEICKAQDTLRSFRKHTDLRKVFPLLVQKVVYDPDESSITLTWNRNQMVEWGGKLTPMTELLLGKNDVKA